MENIVDGQEFFNKEKPYFNWSKWQTMKVEQARGGGSWLTLHYNPEFILEEQEKLKVKEGMPFKVMLKIREIDLDVIKDVFKSSSVEKRDDKGGQSIIVENSAREESKTTLASSFQETIKQIMEKASFSFFWHGWASDPRVWETWERKTKNNIESRSTTNNPVVNILPYGLGIEGGTVTTKINNKDCFTPLDYGEQMAQFINLFGWEKQIDLFGHSMGGIGLAWAALKIIESNEFRKADGSIPDLRLWMLAPAYPSEANIFIENYLKFLLKTLEVMPSLVRGMANPVSTLLNRYLLQHSPSELHQVHVEVARANPQTVVETMLGLEYQEKLTPAQWRKVIDNFPVTIITNPDDRIVSQKISQTAFQKLTDEAIALSDFSGIKPLMLIEDSLLTKADHYPAAGRSDEYLVDLTGGRRLILSPLASLPAFLNRVPQNQLPLILNTLNDNLREIKEETVAERGMKEMERKQNLIDLVIDSLSLNEDEKRVKREGLMFFLNSIFKYYKLL